MTPSSPQPPVSALAAIRLTWAGAVLALVGILVLVLQKDEIRQQVEASTYYNSDVDRTVNTLVAVGVVGGLIGCGLWVWMAIMNAKGRNWARIVATVFASLNLVGGSVGLALGSRFSGVMTATTVQIALSVCSLVIALAIIVLMWLESSSRWYAAIGRARQAARPHVQVMPVVPAGQMHPPAQS